MRPDDREWCGKINCSWIQPAHSDCAQHLSCRGGGTQSYNEEVWCEGGRSLASPPETKACQEDVDTTLETCSRLGFPVAGEKTEGPARVLNWIQ